MTPSETAQDTLAANENVILERPHDLLLFELDVDEDGEHSYRLDSPLGSWYFAEEDRARLFLAVFELVDGFEPVDDPTETVPIDVALDGRPAMAAYLVAATTHSTKWVAHRLDLETRRAVWDYCSEVRRRWEDMAEEGLDE